MFALISLSNEEKYQYNDILTLGDQVSILYSKESAMIQYLEFYV